MPVAAVRPSVAALTPPSYGAVAAPLHLVPSPGGRAAAAVMPVLAPTHAAGTAAVAATPETEKVVLQRLLQGLQQLPPLVPQQALRCLYEIGRGGFSRVWVAELLLQQHAAAGAAAAAAPCWLPVALKCMRVSLQHQQEAAIATAPNLPGAEEETISLQELQQELQQLQGLNHPSIVKLLGVSLLSSSSSSRLQQQQRQQQQTGQQERQQHYRVALVMELCSGGFCCCCMQRLHTDLACFASSLRLCLLVFSLCCLPICFSSRLSLVPQCCTFSWPSPSPSAVSFSSVVPARVSLSICSPGGSLYCLLHERRVPLRPQERRTIALQFVSALSYLHSRATPIVHRDVKSLNIVVGHCLCNRRRHKLDRRARRYSQTGRPENERTSLPLQSKG